MSETQIEDKANSTRIEEVELEVKPVKGESDEISKGWKNVQLREIPRMAGRTRCIFPEAGG